MKRIIIQLLVSGLWLGSAILFEACRTATAPVTPTSPPSAVAPRATERAPTQSAPATAIPKPTTEASAANESVWVWNAGTLTPIDLTTGNALKPELSPISERTVSADHARQFFVGIEANGEQADLYLNAIDLYRAAPIAHVYLDTVDAVLDNPYENVTALAPLISADEQTAFVVVNDTPGKTWRTRLFRIDLQSQQAAPPTVVFDGASEYPAASTASLSTDEQMVFVTRTFSDMLQTDEILRSRVALIPARHPEAMRSIELPGSRRGDSLWAKVYPSPKGDAVYVAQWLWVKEEFETYFQELDVAQGKARELAAVLTERGQPQCGSLDLHVTPDS